MTDVTQEQILEALKSVKDPSCNEDIVSLGMIQGLQLKEGHVGFAIEVDPERGPSLEPLRKEAEQAVHALPGILTVTAVLTAQKAAGGDDHSGHNHDHGHDHGHSHGQPAAEQPLLPDVKSIVAVASGKGGVGKSTTSVNLALGFASQGLKVGLLDADIYGPSIPRMLGVAGTDPESADGKMLEPIKSCGIKCMSIGFLVEEDSPMIWRGPMVMSALEQLMRDVNWGELDILVVDMPPGTGDAQLTMAQRVPLTGAVIVSTPQDIALLDARKGLNMFRKTEVPVLGIIENMSYFSCPHCGERTEIFSHGGAKKTAAQLGADFLGEIPLDMAIREKADAGDPIVASVPDGDHAKAYKAIAAKVWEKVETLTESAGPGLKIVVD
ncbi:MAG: iron-sulfur cluster carrier protein ApbC [Rhodospirillales bacterium]|nr:iron-sulfur cluster carrier protein ApbC [Rhodospirillales bacterium]